MMVKDKSEQRRSLSHITPMVSADTGSWFMQHKRSVIHRANLRALKPMFRTDNLDDRLVKTCHNEYNQERNRQLYRRLNNGLINNQLF